LELPHAVEAQDQLRRAPGGLMAYAVDLAELLRRMAHDVH